MVDDITERKRIEEALRVSEEKHRTLFETMASGVVYQDSNGRIVSANPAAERILGLTLDQMQGRTSTDPRWKAIHEDGSDFPGETHPSMIALKTGKEVRNVVMGVFDPNSKEYRWININAVPQFKPGETKPFQVYATFDDITERKRMEEEIRGLARFPSENPNPVLRLNKDGAILTANPATKLLLQEWGSEVGQVAPKFWRDLAADALSNRQDKNVDVEFGGRSYTFLVKPITDVDCVNLYGRDITERKQSEEALRESEERFRSLYSTMNEGVCLHEIIYDEHGAAVDYRIIDANPAYESTIGLTRERAVGSMASEIYGTGEPPYIDIYAQVASTGKPTTFETYFPPMKKHFSISVFSPGKGKFATVFADITERKRVEEALRESEHRLRRITDNMLDMVVETDLQGVCKYVSQSGKAVLGYDPKDLVGKSLFDFIHPEDRGTVTETVQRAISTGRLWTGGRFECRYRHADGHYVWLENLANIVRDEKGQMIGSIIGSRDITERKRMEDELGKFSQFRESIIDNAYVWLDVLDENANIVVWNKAAEVISGYSREEVTGHGKIWEWLYPDEEYRKSIIDSVTEVLRSGRVDEDFETRIRRKDGQIRIISWNERNLLDEQGKVTGSIAIGQDVTERKRMQEELDRYSKHLEGLVAERTQELSESEKRFRELADLLPQIVFETDETGNVTFGNQAGFAITGYAQEDLDRGFNALQLFAPEERAKARDRIMRALGGERSSGTEYRLQRKDGSTFPAIIFTAAALREGKTVGLRGIAIDITDRKRAEEELRAAKERLDYVVTSNPAVIFTSKPRADRSDYDVTYMSNRVVSMLGFKPEELIGHPEFWDGRVHPDDLRHYLAEVPHLWKDEQHTFEYRFLHKDGTYRWIREETKAIRDAAGKPVEVIGYWTDVTEWKRMEAELVKSQRFATIGETATMVGHDLRNPLQAITGTVYLAKRGLKSRKPAEKKTVEGLLESIDEQVLYMDKIVSDLHDYAQPLTPKFTETSLPDLVKTVLSTVRVPATVKVSVETPKGFANVLVDSHLMRRVLTNLVINAIQAMPKGGKLAIRGSKKGETTIVSVQDTGTGIPEENMDKLFSTFFTTKAKGQGLGLAVCKRLVEAQGGKITVESKPGKGTTFTISILKERT